jgi:hypothetical protein
MKTDQQRVWNERIASYKASGKTMKAWCAEQDQSVEALKYWIYKSRKQEQGQPAKTATTFCSVTLVDQVVEKETLWVQMGAVRIGIRAGFEPKLLREVVAALEVSC